MFSLLLVIVIVVLTGCNDGSPERSPASPDEPPHIVFLVNEDPNNYEAHRTIPPFAERLNNEYGFQTTVISGQGNLPGIRFPGLEVLEDADLLFVFFRRAAVPVEQMNLIRNYLDAGKPLVAMRTANHAFSVRGGDGDIPVGYLDWWGFVSDVLGCENRGYGPTDPGTLVTPAAGMEDHPVLEGVDPLEWQSRGNVYHVAPLLDEEADILLFGSTGEDVEPVAWMRQAGESKVFYTSLGYPDDFEHPQFRRLLTNAIHWALDEPIQ